MYGLIDCVTQNCDAAGVSIEEKRKIPGVSGQTKGRKKRKEKDEIVDKQDKHCLNAMFKHYQMYCQWFSYYHFRLKRLSIYYPKIMTMKSLSMISKILPV